MNIMVVLVRYDEMKSVNLSLSEGATIQDAVKAAGFSLASGDRVAVWNVLTEMDAPIKDGDRIEILPSLTVDPMTARRLREEKNRQRDVPLMGGRNGSKHRLF